MRIRFKDRHLQQIHGIVKDVPEMQGLRLVKKGIAEPVDGTPHPIKMPEPRKVPVVRMISTRT
jgi:hypothetical protein